MYICMYVCMYEETGVKGEGSAFFRCCLVGFLTATDIRLSVN